jgi:hypothetical protein
MTMDEGDTLAAIVRVPREENEEAVATGAPTSAPPVAGAQPPAPQATADPFESTADASGEDDEAEE